MSRIDIALGFDANYAPHAAVVIASVVRNAPGAAFRFIILYWGLDEEVRARMEALAPGSEFVWRELRDEDVPMMTTKRGYLNRSTLFRIGLERHAPEDCSRVLYLDSDVVVLGDVRELWRSDLGGAPVGAIADYYQDGVDFAKQWSLPPGGAKPYFNSGVLLIDLDKVREEKLFTATAAFFVANHEALEFADQDALNYMFWGRWRKLDPAWNVQRFLHRREIAGAGWGARKTPALVHFITVDKPWTRNVWHPWAWLYWDSLKRTSFKAEVTRKYGMDLLQRLRLRLRWWLRRPVA